MSKLENIIKPTGWNRPTGLVSPYVLYVEELFLAAEEFAVKKDSKLFLNILEILKPKEMYEYHKVSKLENDLKYVLNSEDTVLDTNRRRWIEYQLELITFHKIWYEIEGAVMVKDRGTDFGWSNFRYLQDMVNQLGHLIESYHDMVVPMHQPSPPKSNKR